MAKSGKGLGWVAFPHPNKSFDYAGDKLLKHWAGLHLGDGEPFPDSTRLTALGKAHPALAKELGKDPGAAAEQLLEGWRCFHRGDFEQATLIGERFPVLGATLANKASGIYASYLAADADKEGIFRAAAERAERASAVMREDPNAHYFRAFALGRLSQCISVGKALAQGLGGKIRESLDRALALNEQHAEAHTAMGLYHAEIIDKVGAMIGGLTYGAKADKGLKHLQRALELTPKAPIAHIEYANGVLLLYGDKRMDDAVAAYEKAAALKPQDAMEKLDIEYAKEQLEDE
jgi:tetratricopeptide (TPR) repeat protein